MSEIFAHFQAHKASLRRQIAKLAPRGADVDDLLQDTFMRAFSAELKRNIHDPRAFLFQVARNTAITTLRRKKVSPFDEHADLADLSVYIKAHGVSSYEALDSDQKLGAFATALAQLPPKCKQAFVLRRIEGHSFKEIALRMGISVSAAEKHVALGLVRCHAALTQEGYEPSEFGSKMITASRDTEGKARTGKIKNDKEV